MCYNFHSVSKLLIQQAYIIMTHNIKSKHSTDKGFLFKTCDISEICDFLFQPQFKLKISDIYHILTSVNHAAWNIDCNTLSITTDNGGIINIDLFMTATSLRLLKDALSVIPHYHENEVVDYIKHRASHYLNDPDKVNLGKYYTPPHIVNQIHQLTERFLDQHSILMDIACGCGAFLKDSMNYIATDIDYGAIDYLHHTGYEKAFVDNSLINVNRSKYGLSEKDQLIIVGNPPYNDASSKNKRSLEKRNADQAITDQDISCRDIGRSFLNAYAKLSPKVICVIHPLSYLIKKNNFRSLTLLRQDYRLTHGIIISSHEFKQLSKNTKFPLVIALYEKDSNGMSYDDIKDFKFNILGSNKVFCLNNIEQAGHDFIRQTVTNFSKRGVSDIGLYYYNFRDINSLHKSNFQEEAYRQQHINSMVLVNYSDLWKYCYVFCAKKYLLPMLQEGDYYILGNLNPIIDKQKIQCDRGLQQLFIIGAMLDNQHRIGVFNLSDTHENGLLKKLISDGLERDSAAFELFMEYISTNDVEKTIQIRSIIEAYFRELLQKFLP